MPYPWQQHNPDVQPLEGITPTVSSGYHLPLLGFSGRSQSGNAVYHASFIDFHTILLYMGGIGSLYMFPNWKGTNLRYDECSLPNS